MEFCLTIYLVQYILILKQGSFLCIDVVFYFSEFRNHNFFKQLKSSKYYTENQVLFIMNPFFNIRLSDETEIRLNSLTQFCTEGSVLESDFYKHCFSTGKELTFGDSYGNDKEIIPMAKKEYQPSS